jgi:hypothetical protein
MNAILALNRARAAGVQVKADGNSLLLEAPIEPASELVQALATYKAEILALLKANGSEWDRHDWLAYFDERAAIAEYDGGFGRLDAELNALEDCVDHWLVKHPPAIPETFLCLECLLPVLRNQTPIEVAGAFGRCGLLHPQCAAGWKVTRRIEARRQLSWLLDQRSTNRNSALGESI